MTAGPPLFPDSVVVRHDGLTFELKPYGAADHPHLVERIRDDALDVAARSRGWHEPEEIASFAEVFKVKSLFEADGLALVWHGDRVVGLAGFCYEQGPRDGLVLHTCTLGLLPQVQNRGVLPTLFGLLWEVADARAGHAELYASGRVHLTAITQNPFIIAFLSQVADVFPSPDSVGPDPDTLWVARRVLDRFEPEVPFDPKTFVLREECAFFYRNIPYSSDARLNAFCDSHLRYSKGDTFMLVGRARLGAVLAFRRSAARAYPELHEALHDGLEALGAVGPATQREGA